MSQGFAKTSVIDTDPTLAADSDSLVASQKATKAYADTKVDSVTDDGNTVVVVDNTDPQNPVVQFAGAYGDGVTVLGDGTAGNPFTAPGGAGFSYTVTVVNTTPYTIVPTVGAHKYLVDATGGSIVVNFPAAASTSALYTIIKTDASANTVTLEPNGAETINGNSNQTILFRNTSVDVYSDGSNLWIE